MKKLLSLVLVLLMSQISIYAEDPGESPAVPGQVYQPTENLYELYIDNHPLSSNYILYTSGDYIYAPAQLLASACDVYAAYWEDTRSITFYSDYKRMTMTLDSDTYTVDGEAKPLDSPLLEADDSVIVPIKLFADEFGISYDFNSESERISLSTPWTVKFVSEGARFSDFIGTESAFVTVNSKTNTNVSFIVAYYTDFDILLSEKITTESVSSGTQVKVIPLPDFENSAMISKIKLLLLDGANNIVPLGKMLAFRK